MWQQVAPILLIESKATIFASSSKRRDKPQSLQASLEESVELSFAATLQAERYTGYDTEHDSGVDRHNTGQQDSEITIVPRQSTEHPKQIDTSERQAAYPISAPRINGQGRSPYKIKESSNQHLLASRETGSDLMRLSSIVRAETQPKSDDSSENNEDGKTHSSMASNLRLLEDNNILPRDYILLWHPIIDDEGILLSLKDLLLRLRMLMTDSFEDAYLSMPSRAINLNPVP
ncbi:hypothetical protein J1614_003900 [Plenodomus biglobosus]|nr:hypothetical protein J1614_003900 [Plenodomus biglobosus]